MRATLRRSLPTLGQWTSASQSGTFSTTERYRHLRESDELSVATSVMRIATQGLQELWSTNDDNILGRDESGKDLLRISSSEVEESMALFGKAHLFNKATHTGVFADMIFCLFY